MLFETLSKFIQMLFKGKETESHLARFEQYLVEKELSSEPISPSYDDIRLAISGALKHGCLIVTEVMYAVVQFCRTVLLLN
jgi:hypothetical protein